MEMSKLEMAIIEETAQEVSSNEICELNDLQLALVGGGIGDVVIR